MRAGKRPRKCHVSNSSPLPNEPSSTSRIVCCSIRSTWRWKTLGVGCSRHSAPHSHRQITDDDADACSRTLLALLHAPGTLQFEDDTVYVTTDLQLPPTAHARLARALEALDARNLKFTDRLRNVRFRLAERPSREMLQEMMSSKK